MYYLQSLTKCDEEIANISGETKNSARTFGELPYQIRDESDTSFKKIPADTQDRKESSKSPPEVICSFFANFQTLHEVSETNRQIVELLSGSGRKHFTEGLTDRSKNRQQRTKCIGDTVD